MKRLERRLAALGPAFLKRKSIMLDIQMPDAQTAQFSRAQAAGDGHQVKDTMLRLRDRQNSADFFDRWRSPEAGRRHVELLQILQRIGIQVRALDSPVAKSRQGLANVL